MTHQFCTSLEYGILYGKRLKIENYSLIFSETEPCLAHHSVYQCRYWTEVIEKIDQLIPFIIMKPHRIFYHADLTGSLSEHQSLSLDENGRSKFGQGYSAYIGHGHQFHTGDIRRELCLEHIRVNNPNVKGAVPSRFRSIFAALTIHDAKIFAHKSVNQTKETIRVFEVVAPPGSFYFRDMGWLDFPESAETSSDYVSYWLGMLTLSVHENPYIEVCVELPAKVGKIVDEFKQSEDFVWRAPKLA